MSTTEFFRSHLPAHCEPATASAPGLAVDQIASLEFRHNILQGIGVCTAPQRLLGNGLRRPAPIRINGVEFEHRGQDALRPLTELYITRWNTEQFTELFCTWLRAGPGPIQRLGGHAIHDGRRGAPGKDTVATRALKRILVLERIPKGAGWHQILTPLTFNHLLSAHDTLLGEELEDRGELITVGSEGAGEVAGPKGRRGTDAGEALIDLFDHPLQIRMVTHYGVGFGKEHAGPYAPCSGSGSRFDCAAR